MTERTDIVTFKGKPVTLVGNAVSVGSPAPGFTVSGNDLSEIELSGYLGKVVILSSVPSLDTPVCDRETRRFNEEAGGLGDGAVVLTVSMDLPMAQKRWCGAAGIDRVVTASDYKDRTCGEACGLYIKELGLLARAVYVIDSKGVIQYEEIVSEIAQEPDYAAAIAAAKAAL